MELKVTGGDLMRVDKKYACFGNVTRSSYAGIPGS